MMSTRSRSSTNALRTRAGTVALLVGLATAGAPAALAQPARLLRPADLDTMTLASPGVRIAYGADSLQFGDLRLPTLPAGSAATTRVPLAIVLHGGCWIAGYASLRNGAPLADALTEAGVATWNVEYRRTDHPGGGWPGTFRDVAAAADFVRTLAQRYPIDTTRIVLVGHSAGGHLALWLASRRTLAPTSPLAGGAPLAVRGVVSIGGVADLRRFRESRPDACTQGVVQLLGGEPADRLDRLAEASPILRLPLGVPSVHLAGEADGIAPVADRTAFAEAARRLGDRAEVITVSGGHFESMAPAHPSGRASIQAVRRLLGLPE